MVGGRGGSLLSLQDIRSARLALGSEDKAYKSAAERSMQSIGHINRPLTFWFSAAELQDRREDIAYILMQDRLNADFERMKRRLVVPTVGRLPDAAAVQHASPPGFVTQLSSEAGANIRRRYRDDIAFYRQCLEIRREIINERSGIKR